MVPDKITNVDPTGQQQPADRGPNAVSNDPAFRRVLERLEELARQGKSNPAKEVSGANADNTDNTDNTEEFMDAMKKADDDFVAAMDLRRKLEEAYRRNQP